MDKYSILIGFTLFFLTGCHKNTDCMEISLDQNEPIVSEILFQKDSSSYFYDVETAGSYVALLDSKSDTAFWIYKMDHWDTPAFTVERGRKANEIDKAFFMQEVRSKDKELFSLLDRNRYRKSVSLGQNSNWEIQTTALPEDVISSFQFNQTEKELYGVPFLYAKAYPFYYYNPEEGYYWVEADTTITKLLTDTNSQVYNCSLCVNEKQKKAVALYRFTNYLSFYTLEGDLQSTVRIGESPVLPVYKNIGALDTGHTTKCFIDICGSEDYVYCLYSGSSDFSTNPYLIAFKWNGKHYKTWRLDHPIRNIGLTDKGDLIAICSDIHNGQIILRYDIK